MAFNHWPSLLLSLAILVGITICFRRLDYMAINEVKALISVIFGFATSCLLLSFIWLLQRRHNIEPWHMQNSHAAGNLIDVPSMHPDGVPISNNDTWANRATIATVSSAAATMLDQPPNYTDALANSEPVKVHMKTQAAPLISLCQRHSSEFKGKVMADDHQVGPARECCICLSTPSKQRTSETGVDALGLTCQQVEGRKRSFCQLDVGRLLSSSPPKYHEISHKFQ